MSVKIKLEKNGYVKNGFTGFSWTTMFFGFWVPLFRLKLKDFLMFLIFFGVKIFTFYLLFYQVVKNIYFFPFLISYGILIPLTLLTVIFSAEIWISYYYNKYYTENLLADGFCVMEGDEYSAAILKNYTYLPYTNEEMADNDKIERYLNFAERARKTERSKAIAFFVIVPISYIILLIIAISTANNYLQ
ncbi:hypothetical protein PKF05_07105 [Fusobacterium simiae]|uniref:HrgC protein n=1 Tax=Fusobacterium simiae TaxID=855 RepID=A0ABT4DI31_FUSSI|nr:MULTISPECIES: hypothetical protein [Fusobacterium]MCY7008259.1 hypothetical protein [Fusobacterium simiae]MDC7955589.1 hypothetical protein [Fusobacterium simiae]